MSAWVSFTFACHDDYPEHIAFKARHVLELCNS